MKIRFITAILYVLDLADGYFRKWLEPKDGEAASSVWGKFFFAAVFLFAGLWFFDKLPSEKQISEIPRPVLTSEVDAKLSAIEARLATLEAAKTKK